MEANGIAQAALFSSLLLAASVWDLRKRIIPDSICLLIALAGLIDFSPANFLGVLAALPLLIAALYKPDSIGGGDIKLTATAGIVLGFWGCTAGLTLGLMASLFFISGPKPSEGSANWSLRKRRRHPCRWRRFCPSAFLP